MKKLFSIIAGFLLVWLVALPALAAWAATDGFDTYANGDLAGNNGGSGWTTAWSNITGGGASWDVQGTVTYNSTAKGVADSSGADDDRVGRDFTATSAGIVMIAFRRTSTASGEWQMGFRSGTSLRWILRIDAAATPKIYLWSNVGSATILSGYSTDTWYEIHISYDTTANTAKGRLSTDAGWTADVTGQNSGSLDNIYITTNGTFGGTLYFDEICQGQEPPSTGCVAGAAAGIPIFSDWWFFFLMGMWTVPLPKKV